MSAMLASVESLDEAVVALNGGADLIDLKDPSRGALGALDVDVVREIVAAIGSRARLSATADDFPAMEPSAVLDAAQRTADTGVDLVKVGFFPGAGQSPCARALAPLAREVPIVAVLFADLAPDFSLLPTLAECGFHGAMLDTAHKNTGSLTAHMSIARLCEFVQVARELDLLTGLAGSLREPDIPALLQVGPDYLGFRGALCVAHARTSRLDPDAFARVRAAIPQECSPHAGRFRRGGLAMFTSG